MVLFFILSFFFLDFSVLGKSVEKKKRRRLSGNETNGDASERRWEKPGICSGE